MYPPLMVRIEVDHMRQSILHAFAQREVEFSGMLSDGLDKAIADFDFEGEVRRQVNILLPEMVRESVRKAVSTVLDSAEVKGELQAIATGAAAQFIQGRRDA